MICENAWWALIYVAAKMQAMKKQVKIKKACKEYFRARYHNDHADLDISQI